MIKSIRYILRLNKKSKIIGADELIKLKNQHLKKNSQFQNHLKLSNQFKQTFQKEQSNQKKRQSKISILTMIFGGLLITAIMIRASDQNNEIWFKLGMQSLKLETTLFFSTLKSKQRALEIVERIINYIQKENLNVPTLLKQISNHLLIISKYYHYYGTSCNIIEQKLKRLIVIRNNQKGYKQIIQGTINLLQKNKQKND